MATEMAKCRERLLQYCQGNGLDIGCGSEKIRPEAIGVDRRSFPHVNLCMDAEITLPFKEGSLDYVFSSHFLEHVSSPYTRLSDWLDVLAPGGYLVLYLPHRDLYTVPNPEHLHSFTPNDIVSMLQSLNEPIKRSEVIYSALDEGPDRYSFEIVARKYPF